jgi:pimeloyl-ACP methyl ester carboxylesterase
MIEEVRGTIDYDEGGAGPTVVLVPGTCSTGAAWRPVVSRWDGSFRWVTTSLLGYGRAAERRIAGSTDICLEADIVESVVRQASEPVHLVGHSLGGAVALAVTLRRQVPVLSLTIIEAPVPELLRYFGEHSHYRAIRQMTDAYFAAFRAGEAKAIEPMIDFYGGPGTFAAWPERVRRYAVETTAVNILDWASAYGFELTSTSLASIEVPSLGIVGEASHPAICRANQLLMQGIKGSVIATISGAAHFMISTHVAEVARVIAEHVVRCERLHARVKYSSASIRSPSTGVESSRL